MHCTLLAEAWIRLKMYFDIRYLDHLHVRILKFVYISLKVGNGTELYCNVGNKIYVTCITCNGCNEYYNGQSVDKLRTNTCTTNSKHST